MGNKLTQLLSRVLLGRTIIEIRGPDLESVGFTGFDLVLDDGSEVEFYVIDGEITFVALSAEEAGGAHEERKRCA